MLFWCDYVEWCSIYNVIVISRYLGIMEVYVFDVCFDFFNGVGV